MHGVVSGWQCAGFYSVCLHAPCRLVLPPSSSPRTSWTRTSPYPRSPSSSCSIDRPSSAFYRCPPLPQRLEPRHPPNGIPRRPPPSRALKPPPPSTQRSRRYSLWCNGRATPVWTHSSRERERRKREGVREIGKRPLCVLNACAVFVLAAPACTHLLRDILDHLVEEIRQHHLLHIRRVLIKLVLHPALIHDLRRHLRDEGEAQALRDVDPLLPVHHVRERRLELVDLVPS